MTKKKKVKKMKDPNAPKRALSGFFWFSNEERPKVQAANPDFKVQLEKESLLLIRTFLAVQDSSIGDLVSQ